MSPMKLWSSIGGALAVVLMIVGFALSEAREVQDRMVDTVDKTMKQHLTVIHPPTEVRLIKIELEQKTDHDRLTRMEEALKWLVIERGGEYPED